MDSYKYITIMMMMLTIITLINSFSLNVDNGYIQAYEHTTQMKKLSQDVYGETQQEDYGTQQKDTNFDNVAGNSYTMSFNLWTGITKSLMPWSFGSPNTIIEHILSIFAYSIDGMILFYASLKIFDKLKNKDTT